MPASQNKPVAGAIGGLGAMNSNTGPQKVSAHCMEFPENETDKFYVGAEDFSLYQCNLHSESRVHIE